MNDRTLINSSGYPGYHSMQAYVRSVALRIRLSNEIAFFQLDTFNCEIIVT